MAFNVFEQLSVGIILLDRCAKVLFANAAARSLSTEGGPICLNSSVTSPHSLHARRLAELIRSALAGTTGRTMCLPSSPSEAPLVALVSPVQATSARRSELRSMLDVAVMVMLCDPNQPVQIPAAWIRDAYGLTAAEVRVALAIASGRTASDTARALKISLNTVKTHLRRIFAKTGTCRQSELSRLIATIGLARGAGL